MEKTSKVYDIRKRSNFVNDILEKAPNWIISWGNSFFIIFILLLVLLSWFIKYPDIIIGEISITSENPIIYIHSESSGKISELLIKDKEAVHNNQWLAIIDNTANTKDIQKLKSFLDSNNNNLNKKYPKNLTLGELNIKYNELVKKIEQYINFKKYNSQLNNIKSNKLRISKLKTLQNTYEIQKKVAFKEYILNKNDYERALKLYNEGIISKLELEKKEIALLQSKNKYESYNSNIANTESDQSIVEKDNSNLINEKINEELDYKTDILNTLEILKSEVDNWEKKYVIKSHIKGIINFLDIWKENQFINEKEILFSIIPDKLGRYFGRVKIPIKNSGKVKIGQKVNVKLSNYPFEEYGMLEASVKRISRVRNEDYYWVIISLNNMLITNHNIQIESNDLKGTAEIITNDLNLLERFFNLIYKKIN